MSNVVLLEVFFISCAKMEHFGQVDDVVLWITNDRATYGQFLAHADTRHLPTFFDLELADTSNPTKIPMRAHSSKRHRKKICAQIAEINRLTEKRKCKNGVNLTYVYIYI